MTDSAPEPSHDQSIVFEVEVDAAAQPIRGRVRGDEQEISFDGWVGLASAIEAILEPRPPSP